MIVSMLISKDSTRLIDQLAIPESYLRLARSLR
jgi:hypothetical protein